MIKKITFILIFLAAVSSAFSQVIRDNPNRMFQLARSFETEGEIKKAHDIYLELYNKNKSNFTYFNSLVRASILLKKYDEVVKICRAKLKKNPYDVNAYGILGTAYYMQNKRDSAYAVWDKAVNLNGNNEVNYRIIANYALQNRAFEKALSYLQKAKEISHDPAAASFDIANIYSMTMDYKSAAEEYCGILLQKPNMFSVVERRIDKLLNSENAAKEITKTFENCAAENNDKPVIMKLLANIYKITGNKEKAFDIIKEIDSAENKNGKAILDFALRGLQSGDYAISEKAFRYFIENYPDTPEIKRAEFGLAKSIIAQEEENSRSEFSEDLPSFPDKEIPARINEALSLLEKISGSPERDKLSLSSKMLTAEICAKYTEKYPQAISVLKDILRSAKNSAYAVNAKLLLGKIYLREGKPKEAEKYFSDVSRNRSVKAGKKNEANYYLGKIKYYNAEFTEALKPLTRSADYLKGDFTNDAIKLKSFISIFKNDSLSLAEFAKGEFLIERNLPDSAVKVFNKIAENKGVLILNNLAALKTAEIYIALKKYRDAEPVLRKLAKEDKPEIYPDKPMFLLGRILQKEGKLKESLHLYNNFLEKYPNSLYLSVIRENINLIKEEINGRNKER